MADKSAPRHHRRQDGPRQAPPCRQVCAFSQMQKVVDIYVQCTVGKGDLQWPCTPVCPPLPSTSDGGVLPQDSLLAVLPCWCECTRNAVHFRCAGPHMRRVFSLTSICILPDIRQAGASGGRRQEGAVRAGVAGGDGGGGRDLVPRLQRRVCIAQQSRSRNGAGAFGVLLGLEVGLICGWHATPQRQTKPSSLLAQQHSMSGATGISGVSAVMQSSRPEKSHRNASRTTRAGRYYAYLWDRVCAVKICVQVKAGSTHSPYSCWSC